MQYNIFQNDFYEERPGIPWAYEISVLLGDPGREVKILSKAVKDVDLPEISLSTYSVFFCGMKFEFPTRYVNSSQFQVHFYDDNKLSVYEAIRKLFRRTYDEREESGVYGDQSEELRFTIRVLDPEKINLKDTKTRVIVNPSGDSSIDGLEQNDLAIVETYDMLDCYIEKIDDLDLDYSSEDCIEWGMTVKFNSLSFTSSLGETITLNIEENSTSSEQISTESNNESTASSIGKGFDDSRETESTGKYVAGGGSGDYVGDNSSLKNGASSGRGSSGLDETVGIGTVSTGSQNTGETATTGNGSTDISGTVKERDGEELTSVAEIDRNREPDGDTPYSEVQKPIDRNRNEEGIEYYNATRYLLEMYKQSSDSTTRADAAQKIRMIDDAYRYGKLSDSQADAYLRAYRESGVERGWGILSSKKTQD